jgi:hypothetical protein
MIRLIIPIIIIFLLSLLVKTFMQRSGTQHPIDVDPVEASSSRGGARPADDDIIDVEPVEEERVR